jgi:hypothetical protein
VLGCIAIVGREGDGTGKAERRASRNARRTKMTGASQLRYCVLKIRSIWHRLVVAKGFLPTRRLRLTPFSNAPYIQERPDQSRKRLRWKQPGKGPQ